MMVMMMAMTPSLNAASRSFPIVAGRRVWRLIAMSSDILRPCPSTARARLFARTLAVFPYSQLCAVRTNRRASDGHRAAAHPARRPDAGGWAASLPPEPERCAAADLPVAFLAWRKTVEAFRSPYVEHPTGCPRWGGV